MQPILECLADAALQPTAPVQSLVVEGRFSKTWELFFQAQEKHLMTAFRQGGEKAVIVGSVIAGKVENAHSIG